MCIVYLVKLTNFRILFFMNNLDIFHYRLADGFFYFIALTYIKFSYFAYFITQYQIKINKQIFTMTYM